MKKSETVVIVEDDNVQAALFRRVLEKEGIEVRVVASAPAAIDCIDETMPDMIVLDVMLTGPTGFTLLHELRSHKDIAAIPIVLVTSLAEDISPDLVTSYGVSELLDKTTMHPNDLLRAYRRFS